SQTGDGRRQMVPIQEPFAAPAPQSSVISLPTGTVTFVLAEIAGAAALRERGEAAFAVALESCQELLRPLFRGHGGHEVDASREVLRVAFGRASDALAAAVAGHRALARPPRGLWMATCCACGWRCTPGRSNRARRSAAARYSPTRLGCFWPPT